MLWETFALHLYVNGVKGEQMVEVLDPRIQTFPFFQLTLAILAFPLIAHLAYLTIGTTTSTPHRTGTHTKCLFLDSTGQRRLAHGAKFSETLGSRAELF